MTAYVSLIAIIKVDLYTLHPWISFIGRHPIPKRKSDTEKRHKPIPEERKKDDIGLGMRTASTLCSRPHAGSNSRFIKHDRLNTAYEEHARDLSEIELRKADLQRDMRTAEAPAICCFWQCFWQKNLLVLTKNLLVLTKNLLVLTKKSAGPAKVNRC